MVDSLGGCCQICGYDKCLNALDFHHLDPNEKETGLSSLLANPKSWKKTIVPELRKCVCLCNRCHAEIHAGVAELPDDFAKFDESFVEYKPVTPESPCPKCGTLKNHTNIYCSLKCAGEARIKYDWDEFDLKAMIDSGMNWCQIAREVGCSDVAAKKRAKKLGLIG